MRDDPSGATRAADPDVARTLGLDERGTAARWAIRGIVVLALLALIPAGWFAFKHFTKEPAPEYRLAEVARADVSATVEATGTVQPVRTVEVGPEVSGRIVSVTVDFNDAVTEGQVLAEIDPLPIEARRREAMAQLQVARAQRSLAEAARGEAQRTLGRFTPLEGSGAISGRELDAARSQLEQQQAQVAAARAQVALAEASLSSIDTDRERTSVRSPVNGVVLERRTQPGQTVAATFQPPTLFVLAEDLTRMELHLDIDEADVGRMEVGQAAEFHVDAFPDRTFEAIVRSIRNAPRTVQGVVTYEALLDVANQDGLLRPGMTASASVITNVDTDVLTVPNAALRFTPPGEPAASAGERVFVLQNGVPAAIPVERGITDGRVTAVRGRLSPGDEVLTDLVRPEPESGRSFGGPR